jgi:Niemann-Pick C1 protein
MLPDESRPKSSIGRIAKFIKNYYAPFLLKPVVKGIVLLAFVGIFIASVISIQHTQLGLGQSSSFLNESYLWN